MKKMLVFLLCLLVLCLMAVPGASAADISVRDEFAAHFAGFTGTFVMYDPAGDKYIVYNEPQSKKRLFHSTPKFTTRSSAWKPAYWTRRCIHAVQMEWTQYSFPMEPRSYPGIGHRSRWCGTSRSSPRASARNGWEYIDKIGCGNKDIQARSTTFCFAFPSADFRAGAGRPAQQAIFVGNCRSQPRIPRFCKRTSLFPRTAAPSRWQNRLRAP